MRKSFDSLKDKTDGFEPSDRSSILLRSELVILRGLNPRAQERYLRRLDYMANKEGLSLDNYLIYYTARKLLMER